MKLNFFKGNSFFSRQGKVVARIAPSPTGFFHVGTARSALFNYLFAKKHGGKFIVRIEDTDTTRSKKEYEDDILEGLKWLGLSFDELYRQSERTEVYSAYISKLIESKAAYISKEEDAKQKGEMVEVVRLKNPGEDVTFTDKVRGQITFNTKELGDFIIARSISHPLYHLAAVIDDHEMGVTHVIRGEDHISNTPRQILIGKALGIPEPIYAHIPLILDQNRGKMSKRKGGTSITLYRENGYLPEAMLNYLAFLGWNPGTEKELYTMEELIRDFSLEQIKKGGAIFDIQKLDWFNREHLRMLPRETLVNLIDEHLSTQTKSLPDYSKRRLQSALEIITERFTTLKELRVLSEGGEFDYLFAAPLLTKESKLSWKDDSPEVTKKHIASLLEILLGIPEKDFVYNTLKEVIFNYAEKEGRGSVLWPMRFALSGKEKSPDPFSLSEMFGKDETIKRLTYAKDIL